MTAHINRRGFLKLSAFSGALVIGFRLPETRAELAPEPLIANMARQNNGFTPNAYLVINADNTVLIRVHRSEMGQGVNTSVPMILADELEATWDMIRIEQSPPDRVYGDQVTGGSVSMSGSFGALRHAGAAARTMLISAAAQTWGVDPAVCRAENGTVINTASGESLTYGELVETASALPVPKRDEYALKDPADFKFIGQSRGNFDNPAFVNGSAQFASDIQLPGMLVAAAIHCPVFGGELASYDAADALAVSGVRQVVEIPNGLAVVADNTWAALKGRDALKITWDEGSGADRSSAAMMEDLLSGVEPSGDPDKIEAVYQIPYLAHATMEPMVCVADVRADGCDVWAPTQDRQQAKSAALSVVGLPPETVHIYVPLIGGAFGRKHSPDVVREAVTLSLAVGAPVKVFWTRAEDMQHDLYHPLSLNPRSIAKDDLHRQPRGGSSQAYGVPTGYWRSVGEFTDAFGNECFADEVAAAIGQDPLEYRLEVHAGSKREGVLRLAAEKAGWGTPLPEGWGRGIAVHSTFGATHVAHVAEVSVVDGKIRVHRVVCAVDCGLVVNPDGVIAQMQGGILFGTSALLYGEITVEQGRVQQSNFHDYPIVRIDEAPTIEVYIVSSDASSPTGVGEMAVPPIAPAIANALFNATGKRVRKIPIRPEDLQ
jgi:isoquinoline 1-oxidoreductase beta subunit